MKTKARRDELLRAMVAVQPACGKNSQITECVKIEVTEDNIKLTCTDQELVISAEVDCEPGGETGAILVNAATLTSMLKRTNAPDVAFDGSKVTCGSDVYTLASIDPDQFTVPGLDSITTPLINVTGADLADSLAWCLVARGKEATRYAINGLQVETANGVLSIVGTDGRRMAVAQLPHQGGVETPTHVIVPPRACVAILKAARGCDQVTIKINDNQLSATSGNQVITSSLIEGKFPAWRDVIPGGDHSLVTVETVGLRSFAGRASVMACNESGGVRLVIDQTTMTAVSRTPSIGESVVECDVINHGEDAEVSLHIDYLSDAAKASTGDKVDIEIRGKNKPATVTDGGKVMVIMPVTS